MNLEAYCYQFRKVLKDIPKISLLGVRGYYDNNNAVDIYNDAIFRNINGELKLFTASVDPGKYYINHALNPLGCAKLKAGLWKYKIGEHHTHQALVQADEVFVERLDKTGKRVTEEHGWFGINVHSGGPEYLVGRYSAGCQVVRTTDAWKDDWLGFFDPIVNGIQVFGQKTIPYLLVDSLEAIPESVPL